MTIWTVVYGAGVALALAAAWKSTSLCLQKTAGILFMTWIVSNLTFEIGDGEVLSFMLIDLGAAAWCMVIWQTHPAGQRPVALMRVIFLFLGMMIVHIGSPYLHPYAYNLALNLLFTLQLIVVISAGILMWGEYKNKKLPVHMSHPMLFDGETSTWRRWKNV